MSGIGTSIEVVDRVSGALNRITASLYNTTSAFYDVDRASETTFNTYGVQAMAQELYAYENRIHDIENELIQTTQRLEQMEEQTQRATQSANLLKNAYRGVQTIIGALGFQKILETSDSLVQTTSRLDMMNDGLQTTQELVDMVYQSAQNARGSFLGMANIVARFGNNVGIGENSVFGSSAEVVAFAELIQKQMTIAGASTAEASAAMLQLSQGLGSGVLRGDELNSIFDQAPNLIQNIAKYIEENEAIAAHMAEVVDVSYEEMSTNAIGHIRDLAAEGQLSAEIVKAAIFDASEEINTRFEDMPMTWAQIWQSMQNTALMKFQPVLQRLNDIANSERFNQFVDGATTAMAVVSNAVITIFDTIGAVGGFVADNWSIIAPIVLGVAAAFAVYKAFALASAAASMFMAAKQAVLNAVMNANPVMLIVMGVLLLIAALVALCNWIAETTGIANSGIGIIVGALAVADAFVGNIFISLINMVIDIFVVLWNFIAAFVNFFGNVFTDPIGSIARLFFDLVDCVLGLLQTLAGAIDTLFGSNLASSVQGWRDSLGGWVDDTFGKGEEIMATVSGEQWHMNRIEYSDAWDAGVAWGDGVADKLSNLTASLDTSALDSAYTSTETGSVADSLASIASDTSDIKDSVDISDENLKYLRDVAERDVVNRFTTAEIKVDMQNNNTISSNIDIDGIIDQMTVGVLEAMDQAAEGVHE